MIRLYGATLIILSILLINCGTPNEPESIIGGDGGYKIISKYSTPGFAQDVVVKDSLAYIAQGEGGLVIINVSNPNEPKFTSQLTDDLRGYSNKIAIRDSVIYLAAGNFGVSVVNTSDPLYPFATVVNLPMKPARNLYLMGDYLFTSVSEQGVNISEISYATQPDVRTTIETSGYAQSVVVSSDSNFLLIACGEMGLTILNISDFQNGFGNYPVVSWLDTPGYTEDIVIHPALPVAFIACGTGGIVVADFSDTLNVKIVGSYNTGGYAKELLYDNGKLFVTTELRGLQIFDVTNLNSPVLLGTVQTEFAKGLAADEKYIYIADEEEGLVIISKP